MFDLLLTTLAYWLYEAFDLVTPWLALAEATL